MPLPQQHPHRKPSLSPIRADIPRWLAGCTCRSGQATREEQRRKHDERRRRWRHKAKKRPGGGGAVLGEERSPPGSDMEGMDGAWLLRQRWAYKRERERATPLKRLRRRLLIPAESDFLCTSDNRFLPLPVVCLDSLL